MEFVTNYWVVLLVLFILVLLIALSYLIDREIRKMKDSDVDSDIKDNEIEEITDDTEDEYTSKIDDIVNVQMDNIKEIDNNTDGDNTNIVEIDSRELDYDELDVPDIEEDFNKVIHKKKLIDSSIKESVDALEITDVDIKDEKKEEDIVLPEIKIKKDKIENIWE